MSVPGAGLATVGRDNGSLVLRFERRLASTPERVLRALEAEGPVPAPPAPSIARWEVAGAGAGSRVALTTWIDGADIAEAAGSGAAQHLRFERLVASVDGAPAGPAGPAGADLDLAALAGEYEAAVAAALADTD